MCVCVMLVSRAFRGSEHGKEQGRMEKKRRDYINNAHEWGFTRWFFLFPGFALLGGVLGGFFLFGV